MNDGIAFALAAANEALEQADWKPTNDNERIRTVSNTWWVFHRVGLWVHK